jgi:glycosyltransferase involved in cell wall biosynthesis
MRITFIAHHFCIRATKQVLALKSKGHKIYGMSFRRPEYRENFDAFLLCHDKNIRQMKNAIEIMDKETDVWYVHTEPYWMVFLVREVSNKPILLDMHDSMNWRIIQDFPKSSEERAAVEMIDGAVYPSGQCRDITEKLYPRLKDLPSTILPPYVNERFYVYHAWERIGGIVYEGRVDKKSSPHFLNYCKYHELAKKLQEAEIPFYLYSPWKSQEHMNEYNEIALTYDALEYSKLIGTMGCHDWGFCGNIDEHPEWNLAMPNKLFEYMAAGIPIIAMNCKEVEKFVVEHGVGIAVKSVDEIKARWDERAQCQVNVLKKRHNWTMEKHIAEVEGICQKLKSSTINITQTIAS